MVIGKFKPCAFLIGQRQLKFVHCSELLGQPSPCFWPGNVGRTILDVDAGYKYRWRRRLPFPPSLTEAITVTTNLVSLWVFQIRETGKNL